MAHDVFISHSSKDKPIADAICANLEGVGIRCWIAPRDIAPGEDWPTAIAGAISQSRVMVLVFSAHVNSSEHIPRELSLAADSKLVIIPFKIDDTEPEPGIRYYLTRTHWLDAINPPTKEQIRALVDRVKALIPVREPPPIVEGQPTTPPRGGQPVAGNELPGPQPAPRKKVSWVRLLWIPGTLMVFLCLAVLYVLTFVTHTITIALPGAHATVPTEVPTTLSPTSGLTASPGSYAELYEGPGEYYIAIENLYTSGKVTIVGQAFDCAWLKVSSSTGNSGWVSADKVTYAAKCSDIPVVGVTTSGCQLTSAIIISNLSGTTGTLRLWGPENFTFKIPPNSDTVRVCLGDYSYSFSTSDSNVTGYISGGGSLTLR